MDDEKNNQPGEPEQQPQGQNGNYGVDDAFGFRPAQPNTGYNAPVPPPYMNYQTAKQTDTSKRILYILLAVFLGITLFLAGFFTHYATISKEALLFDWAMKTIEENYIGDDIQGVKNTVTDYLNAALKGMTSYPYGGSLDQYSDVLTPAELNSLLAEMESQNADFGLAPRGIYDANGRLEQIVVHSIIGNSPADLAGVREDDVFFSIGGTVVSVDNLQKTFYDPQNVEPGVPTEFVFNRPVYDEQTGTLSYEKKPFTLTLNEKGYTASYLEYYETQADSANNVREMSVLPADTAYLKFKEFSGKADEELGVVMNAFKAHGKKNLILDLRNNGGGSLGICTAFCNYFITKDSDKALVLTTEYKSKPSDKTNTKAGYYNSTGFENIVVLANEWSASASEVLIGAMRDHDTMSALIGTRTYGKGIMQQYFTKDYRRQTYAIKLTTGKWFTPNGEWIQERTDTEGVFHKGFLPEPQFIEEKSKTNYPYQAANDNYIQRALEFLSTKE